MTTNEVRKAIKAAGLNTQDYEIQSTGLGRIEIYLKNGGVSDNARKNMTSEPVIAKMSSDREILYALANAIGGEYKTTYVLVH